MEHSVRGNVKNAILAITILLGCLALRAGAETAGPNPYGILPSTYLADKTTTNFRTVSVVDSFTTALILATTRFNLAEQVATAPYLAHGIRKNIGVSPRFQQPNATCTVQIAYCYWDGTTETINSFSDNIAFVGSNTLIEGTYYTCPEWVFDSHGADAVRVLVTQTNPDVGNSTALRVRSW